MSKSGRPARLTITNGQALVFQEQQSDGGQYRAEIVVDNLTADRVLHIPDMDGILTGLAPGDTWKVNQGGTGRSSIAARSILMGPVDANSASLDLIDPPQDDNTFLFWDGVFQKFAWHHVDYTAMSEVTTGMNANTTDPGVYSHKEGTDLIFRNIVGRDGIIVTQDTAQGLLLVDIDSTVLTFTPDKIIGVVPVAKGGTGLSSIGVNQVLVGNTDGGFTATASSPRPLQYLRSNDTNTGLEWGPSALTFIDLLDTPKSYDLAANKYLTVNSSGTAIQFKQLSLLDDKSPRLSAALNTGGFAITNSTPSDITLVPSAGYSVVVDGQRFPHVGITGQYLRSNGSQLAWDYAVNSIVVGTGLAVTGNTNAPRDVNGNTLPKVIRDAATIALDTSGVVAGHYVAPTLDIDQYGRVTAAGSSTVTEFHVMQIATPVANTVYTMFLMAPFACTIQRVVARSRNMPVSFALRRNGTQQTYAFSGGVATNFQVGTASTSNVYALPVVKDDQIDFQVLDQLGANDLTIQVEYTRTLA